MYQKLKLLFAAIALITGILPVQAEELTGTLGVILRLGDHEESGEITVTGEQNPADLAPEAEGYRFTGTAEADGIALQTISVQEDGILLTTEQSAFMKTDETEIVFFYEAEAAGIISVGQPDPSEITVKTGTAQEELGFPETLPVLYGGSEESVPEEVRWVCEAYDPETEGTYVFTAEFKNGDLAFDPMPQIRVTADRFCALNEMVQNLPAVQAAVSMSEEEQNEVRSLLGRIRSELSELSEDSRNQWTGSHDAEYRLYLELCELLMNSYGGEHENLDDDLIYADSLRISDMKDGIGPFDDADTDGKDSSAENHRIRTFDTLTYTLSYRTGSYGLYDSVRNGYMYFEMILPCSADEALFHPESMGWAGAQADSLDQIAEGTSGYVLSSGAKMISGTLKECQIMTVKRWMTPNETAENAFPGSGTVNAVIHVLGAANGTVLTPVFRCWMDHNHISADENGVYEACPEHHRTEVAEAVSPEVTVTCELRMNAVLAKHTHTEGLDIFDFSTGNELALNKDAGSIRGRIYGYSVTFQLYSVGASGTGADLKGCAIPDGPLRVSVDMQAAFRRSSDASGTSSMNADGMVPLVWSYEGNKRPYSDLQADGRDVKSYGLTYATLAPLNRKNERGDTMPADGSNGCWNGGDWSAEQNGSVVTFTIWPKDENHPSGYTVNPAWFPNGNSGAAPKNQNIYWKASDGVFTARIGCISAGEVYVVVPMEHDGQDVTEIYGDTGNVELTVTDMNLEASSHFTQALPADPGDRSNQGNRSDDTLSWTTFISGAGVYSPNIHYAASDGYGDVNQNEEPGSFLHTGEDAVAAGQTIGITWGLWCDPKGDSAKVIYAANSLLKFDDEGILPEDSDGNPSAPSVYDRGYMSKGTYTWMYAAKPDKTGWTDDNEMNQAKESDLIYFSDLNELKSQGYTCIGILQQFRKPLSDKEFTNKAALSYIPVTAASDENTPGHVYQIRISTSWWLMDRVRAAGGEIPLRPEGTENLNFSLPQADRQDVMNDYVKAVWENGAFTGGHSGDNHDGDSLYVTPFRSEVTITAAQKQSGTGEPARIYSLDADQRYVEYRISPSLVTYAETLPGNPVNVTIRAILPPQLAYSNSFGSRYAQEQEYQSRGIGVQGACTGEILEPEISRTENGETVLVWTLENIIPGTEMKNIYFGTMIDEENGYAEAADQTQLIVRAEISADGDRRPLSAENENISEYGIRLSRQLAMAVSKKADRRFIDPGDDAGWTVTAGNNGASDLNDSAVVDILPQDGYSGDLILKELRILKRGPDGVRETASNIGDWEIWYTYSREISAENAGIYDASYIRSRSEWIRGTVTAEGEDYVFAPDDNTGRNITAAAVIGTLKSQETCRFHIAVCAPDAQGSQQLTNRVFRGEDSGQSTVYIAARAIRGLIWQDDDLDGIREAGEELLDRITLTLLKKNEAGVYEPVMLRNGQPAQICTGQSINVQSGTVSPLEKGQYCFESAGPGEYTVRAESETIGNMLLSPLHASDSEHDSDGEPVYDNDVLCAVEVRDIALPDAERIGAYRYVSSGNDIGLAPGRKPLMIRKEWASSGTELPSAISAGVYCDGELLKTYEMTAANAVSGNGIWQIMTEDFPVFDEEDMHLLSYTVRETEVTGFKKEEKEGRTLFSRYGHEEDEAGTWLSETETDGDVMIMKNTWIPAEIRLEGDFAFTVEKCDENGTVIETLPAEFTLYAVNEGEKVPVQTLTTELGTASADHLSAGEYILEETEAPEGYLKHAGSILIQIQEDGSVYVRDETAETGIIRFLKKLFRLQTEEDPAVEWNSETNTLSVRNKTIRGSLRISKQTQDEDGNTLETQRTAVFEIADTEHPESVWTAEVKSGESVTVKDLPYGTYRISERAPGEDDLNPVYAWDHVEFSGQEIRISTEGEILQVSAVNVYRRKTVDISVEKKWEAEALDEAEFVLERNGEAVKSMTLNYQNEWKGVFADLEEYDEGGNRYAYEVKEIIPEGFGAVCEHDEHHWVFTNRRINLFILKTDRKGNPLQGAEMVLRTGDEVIVSWISGSTAFDAGPYLRASETYVLAERKAPDGYAGLRQGIVIETGAGGEVTCAEMDEQNTIRVTNDLLDVRIEKLEYGTDRPVIGASLKVIDESGKTVDEWVSSGSAHILENMIAGSTYTLIETEAPDGYKTAGSITFTAAPVAETQTITMYDRRGVKFIDILPNTGGGLRLAVPAGIFSLSIAVMLTSIRLLRKGN